MSNNNKISGRNPKGAALDSSHYESQDIVDCFQPLIEPLTHALQPYQKDIYLTARDLSSLIGQIQQFQQDCLGAFNRPPQAPVRIPAKLFKVNKPNLLNSAIYTILFAAYHYRISHGWKKWDWTNPAKKQKNADLIRAIRQQLIQQNWIVVPKIALHESIPESAIGTVMSYVQQIEATLVEKRAATHILYGHLHQYNESTEEDWFRTLEKNGPLVLVHWWYFPDSFDSWLEQTEKFADPEEPPEHNGSWRINVRWLQDSIRFNELMNEEDYEDVEDDEEEEEEEEEEEAEGETIKVMVPSEPPVKIYNPGQQPMIKIRDIEAERPELNSRQRKNEFEPYLNGEITNISQFTASHVEYPKRPAKKQKMSHGEDFSHLVNKAPLDNTIEYPPWYDSTAVHSREQLALPELLDGSLSSIEYMHYRNEIIQLYNKNPDYYLTLSSCKSRLDIDTVLLVRIHSFLESCNLINNKVDPRRRIFDPIIDNNPEIGIRPGSQRNFKDYLEDVGMEELRRLIYDGDLSQHRSLWDIKIEDPKNADGKQVFSCCICNTDCSEIRYQCLKVKDYQVCTDCFLEGRFSSLYFSGDFIRIESEDERTGMEEDWREDETLRLLEGVDRYEDDWLLISEHVGSKSKEQCITRFLQLPINDEFLTAKLSQSELEDLPFAETSNPVMTTVAFLSGHVNPGIGAAAAKSALRELTRSGDISSESMEEATRAALQNAVVAARKLAGYENQEIQHWTRLALKTMLDKLNMKVQQLDEVEKTIQSELNELEKQQGLVAESIEAVLHNRAQ